MYDIEKLKQENDLLRAAIADCCKKISADFKIIQSLLNVLDYQLQITASMRSVLANNQTEQKDRA